MPSSVKNLKLTTYDDIFKTEPDENGEKILKIPLSDLHSFANHPFHVKDDESMQETAASIAKYGVLSPAIARPRTSGGYELISGHRRKRGCEVAGKSTMPVIIRELTDEEATILMVDCNLQRESLLPSEKAYAYKMKLEAIKRQGERSDLTSAQLGQKLGGKYSVEIIAEQSGESRNQIKRYIRLTELIPSLLSFVDEKKISFVPAVELSYLQKHEQEKLHSLIVANNVFPTLAQSEKLKKYSQDGKLTDDIIELILSEVRPTVTKVTLKNDHLKKYFPASYSAQQMEEVILKLLHDWSEQENV